MKTYVFIILALLAIPFVSASNIDHFTTKINMSLNNNVFTVRSEDNQLRTYSSATTFTNDVMTINLYRNTSCRENELYDFLRRSYDNNQTAKLQRQLTNCSASLNTANNLAYFSTNVTFRSKFDTCVNQVTTLQNQLSGLQNQGPALSQCQQDLNKSKSDADSGKYMWAAAGLALGYFLWGRKPFASSPTSNLPQSR